MIREELQKEDAGMAAKQMQAFSSKVRGKEISETNKIKIKRND